MSHARLDAVHEFWFGRPDQPGYGALRKEWFERDAGFDEAIRARFLDEVEQAARGAYDALVDGAQSAVSLLILLDQFPRNLFRGAARAFAADGLARNWTRRVIGQGWDQALTPVERVFAYLPLEHSESLADQDECVRLFAGLPETEWRAKTIDYANRHRDVIARFGRFPHRNAALGRISTPAELEYLAQPGAGF